ncbi:MAG: hypothetical protein V1918_10190 [Planctomycetota bacterium]
MAADWSHLDARQATELLLGQAILQRAREILITRGESGAGIFFQCGGRIEAFEHVPPETGDAIFRHLKGSALLESYEALPSRGLCDFQVGGENYSLEIEILPGAAGEDMRIRLCRLSSEETGDP